MLPKIIAAIMCLITILTQGEISENINLINEEPIEQEIKDISFYSIDYVVPTEVSEELIYIDSNNIEEIKELLSQCEQLRLKSLKILQNIDIEEHPDFKIANENLNTAIELINRYANKIEELINLEKAKEEYPIATEVWNYLKNELEYNDIISSAIMGNIMVEVGGGTLELDWQLGTDFYGLCQWSKKWYPEAQGMSVPEQLDFLKDTIEYEFNWAGKKYKKDFDYEQFVQMTDLREATLAFAMCYERCSQFSYEKRCNSAKIAYDYFVK